MTGLDVFALVILLVLLLVGAAGWLALGMMPGRIARQRGHPQADAIAAAGWWGILTMGLLLPLAWIWAYTRPAGAAAEPSEAEAAAEAEEAEV